MLHGNSVPLYPLYAGSSHIKEYKKCTAICESTCTIWCISIDPAVKFHHRNHILRPRTYGSRRNRMKIYFFLETQGNGVLSAQNTTFQMVLPALKYYFRIVTSKRKMWQKRPNNKHMMWDRKYSKDWHQEKYILWLHQVFVIVSVSVVFTHRAWLSGLDLCSDSSQIGPWVKS